MTDPRWEWFDTITGAVVGAFTAVAAFFGWFTGKLREQNERIDTLKSLSAEHAAAVKVQDSHHQANLIRLCRIEDSIDRLDTKQDKQLVLLAGLTKRP